MSPERLRQGDEREQIQREERSHKQMRTAVWFQKDKAHCDTATNAKRVTPHAQSQIHDKLSVR